MKNYLQFQLLQVIMPKSENALNSILKVMEI
jgi:hypothetical protein